MVNVRILVADDYAAWRAYVSRLLKAHPEWQIICEALDGLQAVAKAAELQPNIILLDMEMPGLSGIEAAKRIRQAAPDSTIIFVTQNNDREIKNVALATGAKGYVRKIDAATELIPAIDAVLRTAGVYLAPEDRREVSVSPPTTL